MSNRETSVRVGVDIGGTFNDYVAARGDTLIYWKELGKHPRHTQIAESIRRHLDDADRLTELVHGSTLAVNALLEGKHRSPALLTTDGFEDVLDLRRQRRPDLYRNWVHHRPPLVPRALRFGLRERIGPHGEVITPLTRREVERVVKELPADLNAVAVCLLHAYVNPSHELLIEEVLRDLRPDLPYVLSSRAFAEVREYERMSSVAAEAYLRPIFDDYLAALEDGIRAVEPEVGAWVMQSVGGRLAFELARSHPTRTVMSGPAGGVVAAKLAGELIGTSNLITFDVGGTSADVALVQSGEAVMIYEREVGGLPLLGASIDVHSIGAGGGSILWVDDGGLLNVGPRSAGALPGPACYGLGGSAPTLSDAHLALGRLSARDPLAGGLSLNLDAARTALAVLAARLERSVEEVAQAAIDITNSSFVNAIRLISVERGYDPRDHTLVAFGGAGPLHAFEVAERLAMNSVLIPFGAGVLSAFGTIAAQPRADSSRSILASEDEVDVVRQTVDDLAKALTPYLRGAPVRKTSLLVTLDMKYEGQNWVIAVPVAGSLTAQNLRRVFERRYRAQYGILLDRAIEYVTVRVALLGLESAKPKAALQAQGGARVETREHRVYVDGEWAEARVYKGGVPEGGITGIAIVCSQDATVFVPRGAALTQCSAGYLFARNGGQHARA